MKNLLFSAFALCIFSVAASAQYQTLEINNMTGCTVFMQVDGNVAGGICAPDYRSGTLGIAPGMTVFNDPSTVPGGVNGGGGGTLGASDFFNMVSVVNTQPIATNMCTPITAYHLSDCYPPMNTSYSGINFLDWNGSSCSSCGTYDITWTVVNPTTVRIDIM